MKKLSGIVVLIFLTFAGCTQMPQQTPEVSTQPAVEVTLASPATEMAQPIQETATQQPVVPENDRPALALPAPIYYLYDDGGKNGLFRLEPNGVDVIKITDEPLEVTDFAINPLDGSIAYITDNKIMYVGVLGENKQVLIECEPISQTDQYFWRERIGRPSWSPDGKILAFSQGGLRILHLESKKVTLEIENLVETVAGAGDIPKEIYAPSLWSPDSTRLIVDIGYYEGSTIGVYHLNRSELVQPVSPSSLCCNESWSMDGSIIYVSSPFLGMIQPGLWTLDPESGATTALVEAESQDGPFEFVGWAVQNKSDSLMYLYGQSARIPDGSSEPLSLHQSGLDGVTGRIELNSAKLKLREVLWAPDYSFALGLGDQMQLYGVDLSIIPASGDEVITIPFNGSFIAWGLPVNK